MTQKLVKAKSATKSRQAASRGLMSKIALVEDSVKKVKLPEFKGGDTVKVHVKIKEGGKERIQVYEGVVVGRSNRGVGRSFRVRKMSHGVGVERVFSETSPKLAKVQVVTPGKVRRSKLYYLRELEGKKAKIARDIDREGSARETAKGKAAKAAKPASDPKPAEAAAEKAPAKKEEPEKK